MAKGSSYERQFCTDLSLWWTGGARTDIFWRTAGSGARATVRSKNGRKTAGSYGDITAIDPVGKPLLDVVTFEVKRGYSRHTVHDLLDRADNAAPQMYEQWFAQAEMAAKAAESYSWLLVHKRDRRDATVWMPQLLWADLHFGFAASMKCKGIIVQQNGKSVVGTTLSFFLEYVTPDKIRELQCSKASA